MHSIRSAAIFFATTVVILFAQTVQAAAQYRFTTLISFDGTNGGNPQAGVVFDSNGTLYGTTQTGGNFNQGTVFRLNPDSGELTTLVEFNGTNGSYGGELTFDASGNLFGATEGGFHDTVFRLDPVSGALTTLVSFNGTNGFAPSGRFVFDANGQLYSTTRYGGPLYQDDSSFNGYGTAFRLDPTTGAHTTLVPFAGTNGSFPRGLTSDNSGNLYGTTLFGGESFVAGDPSGDSGLGTVFRLDPTSGEITTLALFNGTNGAFPSEGAILDSNGKLYGTTQRGGEFDKGTVFQFDPGSGVLTTLISFNGENGDSPSVDLIVDASGKLYGTTSLGGEFGSGSLFRLDPLSGELTTLYWFKQGEISFIRRGLTLDSSGNLYGTSFLGGEFEQGSVFKLSPVVPEPTCVQLLLLVLAAVAGWARQKRSELRVNSVSLIER